jgi:exopolyphosphatase/guanosine-5'-triphosphate,3'-diphosphate pyrophosphatase
VSAERVAVVDLGSNSTRLLVADVHPDGRLEELERRSTVTRLGQGVEASGRLSDDAIDRVHAVLAEYRTVIDALGADVAVGVLTSAVRDAANGEAFAAAVRERHALAARTIPGELEARLTYLGATAERAGSATTAVIDIGGGSTELVVGRDRDLRFHVSTQVGVVRHTERHLPEDPPARHIAALREDAARTFAEHVPAGLDAESGIAVAGTATQAASMLRTTRLERGALEELLGRLASLPLADRRAVPGLDPDRAPTMPAGVAILLEAMRALELDEVEASDHDLLRGAAREHSAFR